MVGWYNVMHISAAEAGALKWVQFVEVGRNSAANGFGDMQNPQSSVLSDSHTSILFVLAAAKLVAFLGSSLQQFLGLDVFFPRQGAACVVVLPRKRSRLLADLPHEYIANRNCCL